MIWAHRRIHPRGSLRVFVEVPLLKLVLGAKV